MHSCEHITVFVDESGDLGFSDESLRRSPIFVIAYLASTNIQRLSNDLKKFLKFKIRFESPELKFHNDSDETRKKVLEFLRKECLFEAGYVAIDKKKVVKKELREDPRILYNYLAVHYVLRSVMHTYKPMKITYVIDRSITKRSRRLAFDEYARSKAEWLAVIGSGKDIRVAFRLEEFVEPPQTSVLHEDSRKQPCLQIADYLAGSVSRAFRRDPVYYNLISSKFRNEWKVTWGLERI